MQDMHTPDPTRQLHQVSMHSAARPPDPLHPVTLTPAQPPEHPPAQHAPTAQAPRPLPPDAAALHVHAPAQRALPAIAPREVAVVYTAEELQGATLSGALDVEIRAHLDLRAVRPARSPEMPAAEASGMAAALLHTTSPFRSIRVRFTPPGAVTLTGNLAVISLTTENLSMPSNPISQLLSGARDQPALRMSRGQEPYGSTAQNC